MSKAKPPLIFVVLSILVIAATTTLPRHPSLADEQTLSDRAGDSETAQHGSQQAPGSEIPSTGTESPERNSPMAADEVAVSGFFMQVLGKKAATGTVLGIHVSPADAALRKHLKLPANFGLLVEHVEPDSAADSARLQRFDVLYKFDDQLLVNQEQLTSLVRARRPDDRAALTLYRDGELRRVEVVLQSGRVTDEQSHELEVRSVTASELTSHTTDPKFQDCRSCHMDPVDLVGSAGGIRLAPASSRQRGLYATFFRRIYLDFLGLPATTQQIDEFASSDGATRVKMIETLLRDAAKENPLAQQPNANKIILRMLLSLDE